MNHQLSEKIVEKWIEVLMSIFEKKYDVHISYMLIKKGSKNNEEK